MIARAGGAGGWGGSLVILTKWTDDWTGVAVQQQPKKEAVMWLDLDQSFSAESERFGPAPLADGRNAEPVMVGEPGRVIGDLSTRELIADLAKLEAHLDAESMRLRGRRSKDLATAPDPRYRHLLDRRRALRHRRDDHGSTLDSDREDSGVADD